MELAKIWLDEYFSGLEPERNFELNPTGTQFQLKVLRALVEIPCGAAVTYGELAKKIGTSARAVGVDKKLKLLRLENYM